MIKSMRIRTAEWLEKVLYESKYIFFDRWSFVHLFSGLLLAHVLILYNIIRFNNNYELMLISAILLFAWELFEQLAPREYFRLETTVDVIWDILIGMAGVILYTGIIN